MIEIAANTAQMTATPRPLAQVEAHFTGLAPTTPAENRITAGILGIPSPAAPGMAS